MRRIVATCLLAALVAEARPASAQAAVQPAAPSSGKGRRTCLVELSVSGGVRRASVFGRIGMTGATVGGGMGLACRSIGFLLGGGVATGATDAGRRASMTELGFAAFGRIDRLRLGGGVGLAGLRLASATPIGPRSGSSAAAFVLGSFDVIRIGERFAVVLESRGGVHSTGPNGGWVVFVSGAAGARVAF